MRYFFLIVTIVSALLIGNHALPVLADSCSGPNCGTPCDPTTQSCANGPQPATGGATITIPNPLGNISDPRVIIGDVIKAVLGLVGSVALILFIYGGLLMMTSAGNSDRVSTGRNTLVWAAIGLMVIFGSYTLVGFLLSSIPK